MKKSVSVFSGLALTAVLASGCVIDADSPSQVGTLTVLWTVDNTTDPAACDFYARDPFLGMDFEFLIYDVSDILVAEAQADCADFGLSLRLDRGLYNATATMVDPITDDALSTSLPLDRVEIFRRTETTLDIDFPPSSFP